MNISKPLLVLVIMSIWVSIFVQMDINLVWAEEEQVVSVSEECSAVYGAETHRTIVHEIVADKYRVDSHSNPTWLFESAFDNLVCIKRGG
tara:strand:- start:2061 stop:2330 length:270 start_codon:yes stop_codon:yes gene_type:complete